MLFSTLKRSDFSPWTSLPIYDKSSGTISGRGLRVITLGNPTAGDVVFSVNGGAPIPCKAGGIITFDLDTNGCGTTLETIEYASAGTINTPFGVGS